MITKKRKYKKNKIVKNDYNEVKMIIKTKL